MAVGTAATSRCCGSCPGSMSGANKRSIWPRVTGLIGFGALERVGPDGHVSFTDVSAALLDQCDRIADELDREGIDAPVERAEWAVEFTGELRERARLARGG